MIVFITGPMFSSKSKRIEEYYSSSIYKNDGNVLVFKPNKDTRNKDVILSRSGKKISAIKIDSILDISKYLTETTTDIFMDEVNFFENIPDDKSLRTLEFYEKRQENILQTIYLLEDLNYSKGINIFLAGLDFNSERKPFGISPYLISIANSVDRLNARCNMCNAPATHTNFKGVKNKEIVVGSDEYEPLCAKHWIEAQKTKNKGAAYEVKSR